MDTTPADHAQDKDQSEVDQLKKVNAYLKSEVKRLISERQEAQLSSMLGPSGELLGMADSPAGWQSGLGLGAEAQFERLRLKSEIAALKLEHKGEVEELQRKAEEKLREQMDTLTKRTTTLIKGALPALGAGSSGASTSSANSNGDGGATAREGPEMLHVSSANAEVQQQVERIIQGYMAGSIAEDAAVTQLQHMQSHMHLLLGPSTPGTTQPAIAGGGANGSASASTEGSSVNVTGAQQQQQQQQQQGAKRVSSGGAVLAGRDEPSIGGYYSQFVLAEPERLRRLISRASSYNSRTSSMNDRSSITGADPSTSRAAHSSSGLPSIPPTPDAAPHTHSDAIPSVGASSGSIPSAGTSTSSVAQWGRSISSRLLSFGSQRWSSSGASTGAEHAGSAGASAGAEKSGAAHSGGALPQGAAHTHIAPTTTSTDRQAASQPTAAAAPPPPPPTSTHAPPTPYTLHAPMPTTATPTSKRLSADAPAFAPAGAVTAPPTHTTNTSATNRASPTPQPHARAHIPTHTQPQHAPRALASNGANGLNGPSIKGQDTSQKSTASPQGQPPTTHVTQPPSSTGTAAANGGSTHTSAHASTHVSAAPDGSNTNSGSTRNSPSFLSSSSSARERDARTAAAAHAAAAMKGSGAPPSPTVSAEKPQQPMSSPTAAGEGQAGDLKEAPAGTKQAPEGVDKGAAQGNGSSTSGRRVQVKGASSNGSSSARSRLGAAEGSASRGRSAAKQASTAAAAGFTPGVADGGFVGRQFAAADGADEEGVWGQAAALGAGQQSGLALRGA